MAGPPRRTGRPDRTPPPLVTDRDVADLIAAAAADLIDRARPAAAARLPAFLTAVTATTGASPMPAPDCDHGSPPHVECPACERAADQGHLPARPSRHRAVYVTARYTSSCPDCRALILPGDEISHVAGAYLCRPCTEDRTS